jgi:excinuclease ABC subunit A
VALATEVARAVEVLAVSPDVPWAKLPEEQRQAILLGMRSPEGSSRKRKGRRKAYEGIVRRFEQRLVSLADVRVERADEEDPDASEGGIADDELGRFLVTRTCDACKGKRLRPEAWR